MSAGLMWLAVGRLHKEPWSANYLFQQARKEMTERPDRLFDLTQPEAIFVEVIPRQNWATMTFQPAEDVGFLYIDHQAASLLFEGDNKRYRIPAGALTGCDLQMMEVISETKSEVMPLGVVLVRFRSNYGDRELCLRPFRTIAANDLGVNYAQRARELQRRIVTLPGG